MQLLEATKLFTQILEECTTLDGSTIVFMPPNPQIKVAEGYKIHITKPFKIDKETLLCLENFVKIHGLTYLKGENGLIIYRKR
jgi:hypothetical protein